MSIPADLFPIDPEAILLPSARTVLVPKAVAKFRLWTEEVRFSRYGNKAVLEYGGEPMFAELVILRMFAKEGWSGVWVDGYRGKYWNGIDHPADLPESVRSKLDEIKDVAGGRGGCFDVVVWRGEEMLFVEAKRAAKDRIRETQLRWIT